MRVLGDDNGSKYDAVTNARKDGNIVWKCFVSPQKPAPYLGTLYFIAVVIYWSASIKHLMEPSPMTWSSSSLHFTGSHVSGYTTMPFIPD